MGSNQFQKEYIEYLQERNAALTDKLNRMKDYYENRVLSRDLYKNYLISTLQDMSQICTEIPQEIDLFFDKMTSAMNILKNVLLRKAEMVQLVEKISKVINSECYNTNFFAMNDSNLFKTPDSEMRSGKRTGTVSPMINGHIISTEPKIYLNRMPEMFTPGANKGTHSLSPIIEASPDISETSNAGTFNFNEMSMPVERLNLNKPFGYMSEDSPKSRFKGPKAWKKSLSSTKCQSENQRNLPFSESRENFNRNVSVGEVGIDENVDPLEGPSWLHNQNERISSPCNFINYRRRRRFASVFDKNEEYSSSYEGKTSNLSVNKNEEEEQDGHDIDENHDDDDDDDVEDDVDHDVNDDEDDDDDDDNDDDDVEDVVEDDVKDGISDDVLYENHKANEDKKNFKELSKRISECSVDLFCEPEEKILPSFEKTNALDKRKELKELVIKLEDCLSIKKTPPSGKSKSKNPKRKNSARNKSTGGSKSPNLSAENEGRKKRKAAPTFKLVEPKLTTKLRRN